MGDNVFTKNTLAHLILQRKAQFTGGSCVPVNTMDILFTVQSLTPPCQTILGMNIGAFAKGVLFSEKTVLLLRVLQYPTSQ